VALQLKNSGYQVTPLKGNLLAKKKTGKSGGLPGGPVIILVVRDSAARGIDVSKIFRTINYETPEGAVDDAHRVGRRGKVDKYGDAIALVTSADALNIHALEQILEAPLAPLENV
jgi:superfamily II DNA/RNA helicase